MLRVAACLSRLLCGWAVRCGAGGGVGPAPAPPSLPAVFAAVMKFCLSRDL